MTFGPAEVLRHPPMAIAETLDHPTESGVLGELDVPGLPAGPWPPPITPLTGTVVAEVEADAGQLAWDIVDEWGDQSFPASDPPSNW